MKNDEVGTLAHEAAKLLSVLQDVVVSPAGHSGRPESAADAPASETGTPDTGDGEAAGSAHDHEFDECTVCPICQSVRLARAVAPDVREHLGAAALSLARAATLVLEGLSEQAANPRERDAPVERIDLSGPTEE